MPTRPRNPHFLPWGIAIICLIVWLATIYAFLPFIAPKPINVAPTSPIQLPYLSPTSIDLSIKLPFKIFNPHIAPRESQDDRLSAKYLSPEAQTLYLVQFKNSQPPQTLSLVTSFPTNTYLIRSNPLQISRLAQDPSVNYIDYYAPEYKLAPSLITNLPLHPTDSSLNLQLSLDPSQNYDDLIQQIIALDPTVKITNLGSSSIIPNVHIEIKTSQLINLARLPQIILIEPPKTS